MFSNQKPIAAIKMLVVHMIMIEREANGSRKVMLIDIYALSLSAVGPGEAKTKQQRSPLKPETHLIVVNVVLVQPPDFVIFLHLFAFVGAALLQRVQQLAFDATKS